MTDPVKLLHGGECRVPESVATCPECGSGLVAVSEEWETETGKPSMSLLIGCTLWQSYHRHMQSDWQPVRDKVTRWAGCVEL